MPKIISYYVNFIDMICEKVGRFVMYWVFFMMFLLNGSKQTVMYEQNTKKNAKLCPNPKQGFFHFYFERR